MSYSINISGHDDSFAGQPWSAENQRAADEHVVESTKRFIANNLRGVGYARIVTSTFGSVDPFAKPPEPEPAATPAPETPAPAPESTPPSEPTPAQPAEAGGETPATPASETPESEPTSTNE